MDGLGYSWKNRLYKSYVDRPCPNQSKYARRARQEEVAPPRYLGRQSNRSPQYVSGQCRVEVAPGTGLLTRHDQITPAGQHAGSVGARRRH